MWLEDFEYLFLDLRTWFNSRRSIRVGAQVEHISKYRGRLLMQSLYVRLKLNKDGSTVGWAEQSVMGRTAAASHVSYAPS